MIEEFVIESSKRNEFIDITDRVESFAKDIKEGIITIFAPHTTAALTINENTDQNVANDILGKLAEMAPEKGNYKHAEGNSDAHLKASIFQCSLPLIIKDGKLLLGTWQGVFFCEFDGPRERRLFVQISGK